MGRPFDEEADAAMRAAVEDQIERGVAGPVHAPARSTTTGSSTPATPAPCSASCLSAVHNSAIAGTRGYGVFRM